jgi:hypothetical protein
MWCRMATSATSYSIHNLPTFPPNQARFIRAKGTLGATIFAPRAFDNHCAQTESLSCNFLSTGKAIAGGGAGVVPKEVATLLSDGPTRNVSSVRTEGLL